MFTSHIVFTGGSLKKLVFTLALALLSTAAAYADTITLNIAGPSQGSSGTLLYRGTVTAASTNTENEYLNGDSFTLRGAFTLDDSFFFNNFPLFLTPGQTFTDTLFSLFVPPGSNFDTFTGTFNLLGGPTASSSSVLSSSTVKATVTPEPSTLFLLGTGLLGGFAMYRRMRFSSIAQGGFVS